MYTERSHYDGLANLPTRLWENQSTRRRVTISGVTSILLEAFQRHGSLRNRARR